MVAKASQFRLTPLFKPTIGSCAGVEKGARDVTRQNALAWIFGIDTSVFVRGKSAGRTDGV